MAYTNNDDATRCRWATGGRRFFGAAALVLALWPLGGSGAGIVFSELMYHPVDGVTAIVDGDEYEFLELRNAGVAAVNLQNASFTKGITYTFTGATSLAAGQHLVVVKNRAAFTNRYPAVTNLAPGVYTGSLANDGEKVTLKDALGNTLYSATYGTSGAWPAWADGEGCSLVLKDPDGNPDDPANWGPSAQYNGTPGATGVCAWADIVINEVLSHTDPPLEDAIEVHNLTTNAVDLGGWYLSDEAAVRRKYRITNAVVAARGHKVFYEYQFNTNTAFNTNNTPFEFNSSRGDRAYLTAADVASNLTRVVDLVRFDAAENGVSFGRFPNGTGDWVTLAGVSLGTAVTAADSPSLLPLFRSGGGASNGLPRVGPVVLSEVMYHPANDNADGEYVELLNVTTNAVRLYDPLHPSNTWHLASAVTCAFPTNLVLPSGGRLLVVGTTNTMAFRALYGLGTNVTLVGPWSGQLNNAGDSLRLYKPDPPDAGTNFVPDILVDRVDYGDAAPWPSAPDGNGPSLERVVATNYGNAAANWFAGAVGGSPGTGPAGGFVSAAVSPAWPQPGQMMTVSVFVVAQTVPSQIVCRTAADGVTNLWSMTDGGTNGDVAAGDRVYTVRLPAPAAATWLYYAFQGTAASGASFVFPAADLRGVRAPPLTLSLCGATPQSTVSAGDSWVTAESFDTVSASGCFSIQLGSPGEVLVDDVSLTDAAGTELVANGGFDAGTADWLLNGSQASSFVETLIDEGSNRVLHVVSSGAPTGWDVVSQAVAPTVGSMATLRYRVRRVRRSAEQWLWVRIGTPPPDVVINEILYHSPDEDNLTGADPREFVELHNPATSSVSLGGWYLDGAGLEVPAGTVVAPGAYLACCASQQAVRVAYGITNTIGNWWETRGQLKNGGEAVTLYNPYWRPVDRVTYDDTEPWPVAADGYGPSLERISLTAVGDTSVNWAASATSTNWIQVAWTGQVGVADASFACFFTNAAARCWLDSVSVRATGGGPELVTNGEFEMGTNGWTFLGNHAGSRPEAGAGGGGSNALAVASTYSRWQTTANGSLTALVQYGDAVSNRVATPPLATVAGTTYVVSFRLRREGLGGDVRVVLGSFATNLVLGSAGTPGRSNSAAAALLPVGLPEVWTDYAVCPTGVANVIRARVDARAAVSAVSAGYRTVGSNTYQYTDPDYATLALRDDGVAPDAVATDGVYAAYLPAQPANRTIVRYHVAVTATNGRASRSPREDDPSRDHGYWVQAGSSQTNLPNWWVVVDGNPIVYPVAARACAVSPDGQTFIDALVRHRGNVASSYETRTGIALRVNRGHLLDTWFAANQGGINFRHRLNDSSHTLYRRVVNEYLGYELQRTVGLATPRCRHTCLWINGVPTITMELEDPEDAFLGGNNIPLDGLVTQVGYAGRQVIGGDPLLDNFWTAFAQIQGAAGPQKESVVKTYLAYESVQQCLALLAITANADQHFDWNMFQHRTSTDRRWRQYPWDVDMSFDVSPGAGLNTTNLHAYYSTPLHPGIYEFYDGTSNGFPVTASLLYPETGPDSAYTLPYRYRQQRSVWRLCHTLFTTNYLYPLLDAMQARLVPAYQQVNASPTALTNEIANVRRFITIRRNYLLNESWSDKRTTDVWNAAYSTTNVVVTELMVDPPAGGQEYVELYNAGTQAVDLGWWTLRVGGESHHLPLGTVLATNAYLVVADTMAGLTNHYGELADPATMVQRYRATPLWDWPVPVWTSATEYATRIVELPGLSLPRSGGPVELVDLTGRTVDVVPYTNTAAWPLTAGVALEVGDPRADNATGTAWRASRIVGTPGTVNSAMLDRDADGLDDAWEQRIVGASLGAFTNVAQVQPNADFDGDGVANEAEFVMGGDPTTNDVAALRLRVLRAGGAVRVDFGTIAPTGSAYSLYEARLYTLDRAGALTNPAAWAAVTNYADLVGAGQTVSFTNPASASNAFFRTEIRLRPRR